jgi:hypothetical protein
MAKDDKATVEMTVIHFKTTSDNATLQENIRAIANTLTRALSPAPRIVQAPAQLQPGNGASNGSAVVIEQTPEIEEYEKPVEVEEATASSTSKAKKNAARQYTQPQVLDLDLGSGDVPLKTFLEQKKPQSTLKRYLAILYWFKHYCNLTEITMDHAYNAYRFMGTGWNVPKDVSGPFRAMKKKQYGWATSGSTPGSYAITHIGENEVNKMGVE